MGILDLLLGCTNFRLVQLCTYLWCGPGVTLTSQTDTVDTVGLITRCLVFIFAFSRLVLVSSFQRILRDDNGMIVDGRVSRPRFNAVSRRVF